MRIIFENNHSPATGRFKDAIVYDPLAGKFWLYDAWGTFIFLTTGMTGQSAYALAVQLGFVGTEEQWVASLEGAQGPQGDQGPQGVQGSQGPAGNDGADGKTLLNGTADPTTEGADGDFYINTVTDMIFGPKTAGAWGSGTSIIGPQGDQGPQGAQGIQGPQGDPGDDGAVWFTGSGAPSSGLGSIGDFYLDSANGDYYEKTGASTWTQQGNLQGPAGAGSGDMLASVYDPQAIQGDAFARANHTGTQPASSISDFDTEVSNNADVAANTAARHSHSNKTTLDAITAAFTTADGTKLDGIETGADVTDATNVGSSIHGASAKTTPVDADAMPLIDSAASNVLKKVTWANIKATLKAYFDTVYMWLDNALADDSQSGIRATFTAGEALARGDICRVHSDGKMYKADASAIATASAIAMATETIALNNSGGFLMCGIVRDDSAYSFTVGGLIYLSLTAGGITQTAPSATDEVIQILGVAITPSQWYFRPELVQVEHV